MKKNQFIVAISGVAASGKDSVVERLHSLSDVYKFSVSYTTRQPRPNEKNGKNYHFISEEEFDRAVKAGEFLEWEIVHGNKYGTKRKDTKILLNSDKIPVFIIDVKGVSNLRKKFKNLLTIMIVPPSTEEAIKRLRTRGTESEEDIQTRIGRYELELSYKNKYDHILVNDDLDTAQDELVSIINKEKNKRAKQFDAKKIVFNSIISSLSLLLLFGAAFVYRHYQGSDFANIPSKDQEEVTQDEIQTENYPRAETIAPVVPIMPEVKKKITSNPPKTSTPSTKITETTKTNIDGSATTTVSTGGSINDSDLSKNLATTVVNLPTDIPYSDETGKYPDLGRIVKDYLASTLKWKSDVSSMKNITLRNAGDSGWNGQYLGSYTVSPQNVITSANGSIIINTYYIENNYCTPEKYFTNCESEYAKFIFAHEYGHHYTLYHKWVDWNLKNGTRFPDSYYTLRPLSKTTTATDYSLGWSNCEIEIIAEDYSYIFSGYGIHQMKDTYGYPAASIRNWLENIGDPSLLNSVANTAPIVIISSPAEASVLSSNFKIQVNASDDFGVSKVSFYVGDKLVAEDSSSPYEALVNSTSYPNGIYLLKVVATDGTLSSEKTVSVTFENEVVDIEKPSISILSPTTNPYNLSTNQLSVSVLATDNVAVDKIEAYFENELQQSWNISSLNLSVSFQSLPPGSYHLKFKAYDKAGNSNEVELVIAKGV